MSECYQHEKQRRLGSPCPYCINTSLREEITALKEKVRDLQDGHDLHSDEFERIKSLYPDNPELVGICSRAIKVIKQKVPVIVQRDNAIKDLAAAENELATLRKVVGMMEKGEWGYKSVASNDATFWYINNIDAKAANLDIAKLQKMQKGVR